MRYALFETCCCASSAVPCWRQQAEAPQETPKPCRRALLGITVDTAAGILCHTLPAWRSDRRLCGSQVSVLKRPWYAGHPAGGNCLHLYRRKKKFDPNFEKKWHTSMLMFDLSPKTEQAEYLHWSPIHYNACNSWRFAEELDHVTQKPRSSLALNGKSHMPVETCFVHLMIRFICSKIPARCDAELATPCPQEGNYPGITAPSGDSLLLLRCCWESSFPADDSMLSPLIGDHSHTVILLISSLCY